MDESGRGDRVIIELFRGYYTLRTAYVCIKYTRYFFSVDLVD